MDNVIQFQTRKQKTEKTREEIYAEMVKEGESLDIEIIEASEEGMPTVPRSLRSRVSDAVRFDNRSLQPTAKNQTGFGL